MQDAETMRRQAALADIFEETATSIIDRVAGEGARAGGLTLAPDFMRRYTEGIRSIVPDALDTVREADPALQASKLDGLAASIRAVSDANHVSRLVERGVLVVAFGFASEVVRRRAEARGFTPDALDRELRWFQEELERRLG